MGNRMQIQLATTQKLQNAGLYEVPLQFGGAERNYLVYIPQSHWKDSTNSQFQNIQQKQQQQSEEGRALVIAIHGGGGNAKQLLKSQGDLLQVAEEEGFQVVFPQGSGALTKVLKTWNCYPGMCGYSAKNNIDDTSYILSVISDIAKRTKINERRIYAMGLSNGGMMCYRLAVDPKASLVIAAICPIAGGVYYATQERMPKGYQGFAPSRPISVCHIHSVDDPRALYEGGLGPPFPFTKSRVEHHAVKDMIKQWVEFNGCTSPPSTSEVKKGDVLKSPNHTATEIRYRGGRDDTEVVHWKLTGAGHVWPSPNPSPNLLAEHYCGENTSIIDANRVAWNFFKSHPLPLQYLSQSPIFQSPPLHSTPPSTLNPNYNNSSNNNNGNIINSTSNSSSGYLQPQPQLQQQYYVLPQMQQSGLGYPPQGVFLPQTSAAGYPPQYMYNNNNSSVQPVYPPSSHQYQYQYPSQQQTYPTN